MKKFIKYVILVLTVVLVGACQPYKDFKIVDAKLLSTDVHGLKGMDAVLEVTFSNPAGKLKMTEVFGNVIIDDKPILDATIEDFSVGARGTYTVQIPVKCKLSFGTRLGDILKLTSAQDLNNISISLQATCIGPLGFRKVISRQDIPAAQFLNK